ncbi:hypothetical protein AXK56_16450 [Tsukamurella pulmonis]|uniref:Uncharacterized protein n=1 Tax=Tsukamurella pulmonis TaxID=47312 RepID=A0A1H1A8R5_9ACTN|nr:hypothetical protein [Tsukamurella pulmonis]KXO95802.1 hypothetical protein AXK56_16450 [Tsukamurella pulmonis]SDQ35891.1 hypothetical protein SAMN04489765_0101 [Tsukamurella pulmonis]SUQ39436.1 Uncharacterised protein [Tsukamurella pulmonis]
MSYPNYSDHTPAGALSDLTRELENPAGQHPAAVARADESVFPFNVSRYTVGMIVTTGIAALLAFTLTWANNWLAVNHGIPWSSSAQSTSTNLWGAVFLAVASGATFLLLVWLTDRPHLLYGVLAALITLIALGLPWATDISPMAGFLNGVAHAAVVITIAALTESLGRAALIRAQDPNTLTY